MSSSDKIFKGLGIFYCACCVINGIIAGVTFAKTKEKIRKFEEEIRNGEDPEIY